MRKLVYYVACTVDGFICRRDGSLDCFLDEGEHLKDLFEAFPETIPAIMRSEEHSALPNKWFDVVLMGRRTYEVGTKIGLTNPYPTMKQLVVSRSMKVSPDENVELISEDPRQLVQELKKESGKDIWLCGGGELAAVLFAEIDEMIVKVNPVLLGSGVPLFSGDVSPAELALTDSKIYPNGFMILRYALTHCPPLADPSH